MPSSSSNISNRGGCLRFLVVVGHVENLAIILYTVLIEQVLQSIYTSVGDVCSKDIRHPTALGPLGFNRLN
jgi:hypothetical protein